MIKIRKKGQMTIFVIIALLIVGSIGLFFAFKAGFFAKGISAEFSPIYELYDECIEQESRIALELLGSQGGRIDTGNYIPGSEFAPFSSELVFMGISVPYWYYISGNNLITEQVPKMSDMENEISNFVLENLDNCDFSNFYEAGFSIDFEIPKVRTVIKDEKVEIEVSSTIVTSMEERSARKSKHKVEVRSKLGKFYDTAKEIYNKQAEEAFLETYAVDVLRSYAPVDGVEIQCTPKIWKTEEVVDDLKNGLQFNFLSLKMKGDYYTLNNKEDNYFVIDHEVDDPVSFVYLAEEFPSKVEITPADNVVMLAEPVGNQQGMGLMGFCYVPYHFVYDVSFPVLIQIYDGEEIFQFPVAVIIDNNVPREADLTILEEEDNRIDVCSDPTGTAEIHSYDVELNPVKAEVSYKCLGNVCNLGETDFNNNIASLQTDIPVCLNGQLIVKAEGYKEKKQLFSSNSESFVEVILDREYEVDVNVVSIGGSSVENAIIYFQGENELITAVLPDSSTIKLSEGAYEITAQVFGSSPLTFPKSTKRECREVPRSGVFGIFGAMEEQCFNIEFPETNIDFSLLGGGKAVTYILESDLKNGIVNILADSLPTPSSIDDIQYNYEIFETMEIGVDFE